MDVASLLSFTTSQPSGRVPPGAYWACLEHHAIDRCSCQLTIRLLGRLVLAGVSPGLLTIDNRNKVQDLSHLLSEGESQTIGDDLRQLFLNAPGFNEACPWDRDRLNGRHLLVRCEPVGDNDAPGERWTLLAPQDLPAATVQRLVDGMRQLQAVRHEANPFVCACGCAGWRHGRPVCDGSCTDPYLPPIGAASLPFLPRWIGVDTLE